MATQNHCLLSVVWHVIVIQWQEGNDSSNYPAAISMQTINSMVFYNTTNACSIGEDNCSVFKAIQTLGILRVADVTFCRLEKNTTYKSCGSFILYRDAATFVGLFWKVWFIEWCVSCQCIIAMHQLWKSNVNNIFSGCDAAMTGLYFLFHDATPVTGILSYQNVWLVCPLCPHWQVFYREPISPDSCVVIKARTHGCVRNDSETH